MSQARSRRSRRARPAADQLPAGVEQRWIDLARHPLPEFEDLRHDSDHTRLTRLAAVGDVLRDTEALARAKTFFAGGRRGYAVMSFVVNRAQAAEPKTAA
ncbi:hypothetical protein [Streptomyces sp. NPDC127039]|uniref:hypothetical protein n=1 Tax=Streptomyces sp. NPDC127039 TaxID=3347115 RepID=UPI0036500A2B